MENKKCNGINTSSYKKGSPCCANVKYEVNNKWYCANHAAQELKKIVDKNECQNGLITRKQLDNYLKDNLRIELNLDNKENNSYYINAKLYLNNAILSEDYIFIDND